MTVDRTVVVVDDEDAIVTALRRTIESLGVRVFATTDPREALTKLNETRVDVLVSDLDMPEMSGHELLALARANHPEVVRVILSGQNSMQAALKAINDGEVFRFLQKPWSAGELRDAIGEALARAEQLRAARARDASVAARERAREALAEKHGGLFDVRRDGGSYVIDEARLTTVKDRLAGAAAIDASGSLFLALSRHATAGERLPAAGASAPTELAAQSATLSWATPPSRKQASPPARRETLEGQGPPAARARAPDEVPPLPTVRLSSNSPADVSPAKVDRKLDGSEAAARANSGSVPTLQVPEAPPLSSSSRRAIREARAARVQSIHPPQGQSASTAPAGRHGRNERDSRQPKTRISGRASGSERPAKQASGAPRPASRPPRARASTPAGPKSSGRTGALKRPASDRPAPKRAAREHNFRSNPWAWIAIVAALAGAMWLALK